MTFFAADNSWNVTVVDGSTYTGQYAADQSLNVIRSTGNVYVGATHPCGARYVTTSPGVGFVGREAPDGSLYVNTILAKDGSQSVTIVSGSFVLPMDVAGTTWSAAYGVRSLSATYLNGNLFDVVVGVTTTTIPAVNGHPNMDVLNTALSAGVGYVSKWYDQTGGGNHLVQTTANQRPAILVINNQPVLIFDGYVQNNYSGIIKNLVIPAGVALNSQASTHFFAIKAGASLAGDATNPGTFFGTPFTAGPVSTAGSFALIHGGLGAGGTSAYEVLDFDTVTFRALGTFLEVQPSIISMELTAASTTIRQNETTNTLASTVTAGTSAGGLVGYLFGPSAVNAFYGQMSGILLSNTIMTTPQKTAVRNALYSLFSVNTRTVKFNIHVDGSSIEQGYGAIPDPNTDGTWGAGYGYVDQLITALQSYPIRWGNSGLAGGTIQQGNTFYSGTAHSFFTSIISGKKILIGAGFNAHNSFSAYKTANPSWTDAQLAAAAFSDLQTYITTAKTDAWDKIFVLTDPEGGGAFGFPAAAALYNASVKSGAAAMGVTVIDVATAVASTITANWSGGQPYFNTTSDVHPSILGHTQIANAILPTLQIYLST